MFCSVFATYWHFDSLVWYWRGVLFLQEGTLSSVLSLIFQGFYLGLSESLLCPRLQKLKNGCPYVFSFLSLPFVFTIYFFLGFVYAISHSSLHRTSQHAMLCYARLCPALHAVYPFGHRWWYLHLPHIFSQFHSFFLKFQCTCCGCWSIQYNTIQYTILSTSH